MPLFGFECIEARRLRLLKATVGTFRNCGGGDSIPTVRVAGVTIEVVGISLDSYFSNKSMLAESATYHAISNTSKSKGHFHHATTFPSIRALPSPPNNMSISPTVRGRFRRFATAQTAWRYASDTAEAKEALVKKANAVPMAVFNCCLDTFEPPNS